VSNPYPRTFQDIAAWSLGTATPIQDARTRFAQFVILCGIASEPSLRNNLVFKGGNALDFVLQPNRSTIDLDFSLDMTTGADLANAEEPERPGAPGGTPRCTCGDVPHRLICDLVLGAS
jgi:hypothetical protein